MHAGSWRSGAAGSDFRLAGWLAGSYSPLEELEGESYSSFLLVERDTEREGREEEEGEGLTDSMCLLGGGGE
jgi:hypothetical protein